jgi:D-2-hydroxyacid dehydrogenase (NADP+)
VGSDSILIYEPDSAADAHTYAAAVADDFPGLDVRFTSDHMEACQLAADASVLIAKAQDVSAQLVAAAPKLEWIHALTSGTDHLDTLRLPASVTVTSARGMHGPQMAELAILLMLALSRDLPRMLVHQHQSNWQRWAQPLLLGKTAVIVGVGSISEALATRCQAFGLRVVGVSSGRTEAAGFDEVQPRARLAELAARADFLILLVPYTAETHHLVDASVLAAMKKSAFVINIARGSVIDEAALVEALRAGRIAGAGLDVFASEPPAHDNPLWRMKNVIMTPHIGGLSGVYAQQALPVLLHNLRCYRAGDWSAMQNLVRRAG